MQLIKEYINEKFTKNESDPIRDMGIGLYAHRDFNTIDEAVNWLIEVIPAILGVNKIPKNIMTIYTKPIKYYSEKEKKDSSFEKLSEYILKYVNIKELTAQGYYNDSKVSFIICDLYKKIEELGYKRWR